MDAIEELKLQVINDFIKFMSMAEIGIIKDYSMILHKISFIQSCSSFDKVNNIYEFLKNN